MDKWINHWINGLMDKSFSISFLKNLAYDFHPDFMLPSGENICHQCSYFDVQPVKAQQKL